MYVRVYKHLRFYLRRYVHMYAHMYVCIYARMIAAYVYRILYWIVISFHSKHGAISSLNFHRPSMLSNCFMPQVELFEISRPCSPKRTTAKVHRNFGRDMSHQAFHPCHSRQGSQMFEENSSSVQNAAVDSKDKSTALILPFKTKYSFSFKASWAYLLQPQQAYERVWSKGNICSHSLYTYMCIYIYVL